MSDDRRAATGPQVPPPRVDLEDYATRLARRERQQAAVAHLGSFALGADVDALLQLAVRMLAGTLECELAKVLELLPDGRRLLLRAGVGWDEGLVGEATVDAGLDSQAGYTLASRSPVIVEELAGECRFRGPSLLVEHGVVSGMSAAIGAADAPWGVLGVHARRRVSFDEDDVHFFLAVAHVLWMAIARERSEVALRESRMRLAQQVAELETIYRQTPVGLAVIDAELRFVRVNEILAELTGASIEASLGRRVSQLIPGELGRWIEESVRAVLATGRPSGEVALENVTAGPAPALHHWIATYHPLASEGAAPTAVICVVREVTEERQAAAYREAEHAVSQALARAAAFEAAIPAVLDAFARPLRLAIAEFWRPDAEGQPLRCALQRFPGAPGGSERWERAAHGLRLADGEGLVGRAWKERRPLWMEELGESDLDGRWPLFRELGLTSGGALPVAVGEDVVGVLCFFARERVAATPELIETMAQVGHEVGEAWRRVRAETAVRASEQLFRDIVEEAPIPIFLHAFDGAILGVNRAFTAATGYAAADLPRKRDWEGRVLRMPEERIDERIADLHHRLREPSRLPAPEEVTIWTRAGRERRWVLYRCPPMRLADGREFATTMAVDITERELAERALAEARDAAEAASRMKSAFLANVSHEIRTPMTAILGYADVLGDDVTDPRTRRLISTIKRNGLYLIDVIDDILDISRIEADRLEVERERISPVAVLSDVASLMRVRAEEKQLALRVDYEGPMPATIESDSTRLRQILINLVGNAVKFTERGEVRIVARLLAEEPPRLRIDVVDTGVGIEEDVLEHLFEPFVQGQGALRSRGGAGLGLAISRRLAHALGGELSGTSRAGGGSRFSLEIPTGSLEGVPVRDVEGVVGDLGLEGSAHLPRLDARVLVVDDQADVRELADQLLRRCGARPVLVEDGERALAAAADAKAQGDPFAVIVLDMQLPGLDGYEAARRLRREGFTGAIVALTAAAMTGDRERCLDAGCSDYVAKPIVTRELLQTVARLVEEEPPSQGRERVGRVLIVEDDADARLALALLLERRGGHEVRGVGTGGEALALVESWVPEVVLVDLKLPDMDGFAVVDALRRRESMQDSVFIALSGRTGDDVAEQVRVAGFHHHVPKPVRDVADLLKLFPSA